MVESRGFERHRVDLPAVAEALPCPCPCPWREEAMAAAAEPLLVSFEVLGQSLEASVLAFEVAEEKPWPCFVCKDSKEMPEDLLVRLVRKLVVQ